MRSFVKLPFFSPTKNFDDQEIIYEKSNTQNENNWLTKNNSLVCISKDYTISKSFQEILALRDFIQDKDCPELDEIIV